MKKGSPYLSEPFLQAASRLWLTSLHWLHMIYACNVIFTTVKARLFFLNESLQILAHNMAATPGKRTLLLNHLNLPLGKEAPDLCVINNYCLLSGVFRRGQRRSRSSSNPLSRPCLYSNKQSLKEAEGECYEEQQVKWNGKSPFFSLGGKLCLVSWNSWGRDHLP